MKRKFTCFFLFVLLGFFVAKADLPGKPVRKDITVTLKSTGAVAPWTLHYFENFGKQGVFTSDTVYTVTASAGKPREIGIYAGNASGSNTDTLFLSELSQKNYTINFKEVTGTKLGYELQEAALATTADTEKTQHKSFLKTNELLLGISFASAVLLIVYFFWRKKKKDMSNLF